MSQGGYSAGVPGYNAAYTSFEAAIMWGGETHSQVLWEDAIIDSTAVDATNTPTSVLRPGLVMAKLDSGAGWVDYDADATDGSEYARGVLVEEIYLLDPVTAASADRFWRICRAAPVKAGMLIGLDYQARGQLRQAGFVFDDDYYSGFGLPYSRVIPVTGDTTVTAANNGALYLANGSGASTFTLPTIAAGLHYTFLNNVGQNMVIASAGSSDNIIGKNDAGADTVTFSTSMELIGSSGRFVAIYTGASTLRWAFFNLGGTTATLA